MNQDFSKILVVLGLRNSGRRGMGRRIWELLRLMAKIIGLRRLRANVTVTFKLEFAKILSSSYFWAARARRAKRAAPSPK